jgi:hypothetical protein
MRCVSKDGRRRRPCKLPSFETPGFAGLLRMRSVKFEPIGFKQSIL